MEYSVCYSVCVLSWLKHTETCTHCHRPVTSRGKYLPLCEGWVKLTDTYSLMSWCHFQSSLLFPHSHTSCVTMCLCLCCHIDPERSVPTRLKQRCSEVGCPFPTGSPFQRLEIPLCTKKQDMIPQHCRQGRELGTVLIRQAPLSGKILKGMQPIVVNCMGPHSLASAAGMCYLFWIGEMVMISAFCFVLVSHFSFLDSHLFQLGSNWSSRVT